MSHPLRFSSVQTTALVRCGARLAESLLAALPSPLDGVAPPEPRDHDDDTSAPSTHTRGDTPVGHTNPVTEIRLLGWKPAVTRADGTSIALSPRRAELLALLAYREAWSARALSEALYDDPSATTTVRGEVRRLRQLTGLSIESQPYSLSSRDRACVDFLRVAEPDELLPDSEIPAIIDLRYGI